MATRSTPGAGRAGCVEGTTGCLTADAESLCDDDDDKAVGKGAGDRDFATSSPLLLAEAALGDDEGEDDDWGVGGDGDPAWARTTKEETAFALFRW